MKSKTSFFNKAIFKKNITLYWPIWTCYLLYLVVKLCGGLWSGLRQTDEHTKAREMVVLVQSVSLDIDIWVIAAMVVVTGMALFSYLFAAKSANMIHALPVTRKELFFTNVVSGLSFLWIPELLTFLLSVFVCLANGISLVQYLGMWVLSVMGISLFLFSLVVFCSMFTGQILALPVYFFVLNFLGQGIATLVRNTLSFLGYGISSASIQSIPLLQPLSPIQYLLDHVSFSTVSHYDEIGDQVVTGVTYRGGVVIFAYAMAAFVVLGLSYYGYRKRALECAGDLLAFDWIKPVFRWGVGLCVAYGCTLLIANFLDSVFVWVSAPLFFAMVLLLALLAFLIADMFVQKNFHIIKKARVKECVAFLAFAAVSFAGVYFCSQRLQNYIPNQDSIEAAYVEMNYPVEFEEAEVQTALDLQKKILSRGNEYKKNALGTSSSQVSFTYHLKDGRTLSRQYKIPYEMDMGTELINEVYGYETQQVNFLKYEFGCDYDKITQFNNSQLEYYDGIDNYVNKGMSEENAQKLYQAVVADAGEGTIQKYNTYNYAAEEASQGYATAAINFSYLHSTEDWQDIYQRLNGTAKVEYHSNGESGMEGFAYIQFGSDCTNILNTLVEMGMIDSIDAPIFSNPQ